MADLQDTNAATEKIYEPLLIVDCPVSNEMISQSSRRMAASTRKSSLSLVPVHYLLIRYLWKKRVQELHRGSDTSTVSTTKTGRRKSARGEQSY